MNKRLIAFLPILSLFLSLPLIPINAAAKAGGTCSKAGITSVVSGKTYTCIKSGKKLVWDKGVAVAKPTQIIPVIADVKLGALCTKAGIIAVASGTTYTCTLVESFESTKSGQKSLGWFLKWREGLPTLTCDPPVKKEVVPTSTPVKKKAEPLPSIAPIKSADYPLVGALAKNMILNQKGSVHNPFVIYWDPTTTELKRKFYSEQIEIMKNYFSPMIPNNSKANIYILGSDKEWACEVFKKAPDAFMFSTMYQVSTKCATTPQGVLILDAESGPYTNYRGAGQGLSVLGTGAGMVALSNCDKNKLERDILIHETFHAIQWIYTSFKLDSKEAVKLPKVTGPLWIVEGSATYMGYLLSADGIWTSYGEDKRGNILANSGSWKNGYEKFNADGNDAYSIGAVMYEYMLAKYGLERTLSFWPEVINSLSTKDLTNDLARRAASKVAFQTVFGLSVEDFLNEVKPYIEWSLVQADRVRNSSQSNSGNSSGGATPTPKPTETEKPTTSTDIGNPAFQELGAKCIPAKETSGKTKDGTQLMCIAVSAAEGSWQKK
jgi:hypothetical protein